MQRERLCLPSFPAPQSFLCLVMENTVGNTNTDVVKQEESIGNIPSPLFSGTKPKKRLISKVWDDFMPTFIDRKVARATCMHCHHVFNCNATTATTGLRNHQVKCSPGTHKSLKLQEPTLLPYTQQNMAVANSDPNQKKLPFLLSSHKKGSGTADAMPEQDLALPYTHINTDRQNKEVDQNGLHDEHAICEQNNLALSVICTDKNKKNQGVDQMSHEELIRILAMHGHATRMVEQDDFRKLVAHLNPVVKVPSHYDLMWKTFDLFDQEKSKLKENAEKLSCIILRAIGEWGLDDKVFSITLDDAFVDDSVASNVKTSLQKRNKVVANQSLFVARYATHLLDEVIQVGLDELDTIIEQSVKCSRYKMDPTLSLAHYPNWRYAPSVDNWRKAQKICDYLQDFHRYKDIMHKCPSPDNLFDMVWNVKEKVHRNTDIDRFKPVWEVLQRSKEEEGLSTMRWNMENKFKECWKVCFLHFCMPMVMDPKYRLEHIKSRIHPFTVESAYTVDSDIDDYICEVHDTLLNLYGEYSNQIQEPDCTSWSKISTGKFIGRDVLHELYLHTEYPYGQRPLTELDHYLQEARLATGIGQDCDGPPDCVGEEDEGTGNGMEDVVDNVKNELVEQEESTGSIPSPLFCTTRPNKRLRSKVWDDFIPTFVDGKVVRAECMHCHRTFNYNSTNGTTGLHNHQSKCSPGTRKRARQHENTPLPSTQKSTAAVSSDPK
ncbi:hypothetical protein C2845_PM04G14000 [Panicum miliaceum]|uniref:BED-type domain-containing protein n=1 Tax=Panicum miliaceum TaxID=4540 RepID=A0A3L6QVB0_PANMI|nr:hypothetical protein C2845_PM04G14000 [Panicum miliaceum]